jgi:hypothetical protein
MCARAGHADLVFVTPALRMACHEVALNAIPASCVCIDRWELRVWDVNSYDLDSGRNSAFSSHNGRLNLWRAVGRGPRKPLLFAQRSLPRWAFSNRIHA